MRKGICRFFVEYTGLENCRIIELLNGGLDLFEKLFAGGHLGLLEKSMGAASLRQRVIANNIANVNTPGFKKSDVIFEDALAQAMLGTGTLNQVRTHSRHLSKQQSADEVEPQVVASNGTTMRNDGNNVDIEAEMAQVAQNNLYYNTLAQQLSAKLKDLKTAINQGGR